MAKYRSKLKPRKNKRKILEILHLKKADIYNQNPKKNHTKKAKRKVESIMWEQIHLRKP